MVSGQTRGGGIFSLQLVYFPDGAGCIDTQVEDNQAEQFKDLLQSHKTCKMLGSSL